MKISKALFLSALTLVSAKKLKYLGVNEAGGDFGEGHLPGVYNTHYTYPNIDAISISIEQGMNAFRMGLRWERFQHELFGELTEFDLTEYKKIVDAVTAMGAVIIVDPHNYARYKDKLIGSEEVPTEAFVDFWKKMANVFKDNDNVWFGLVNEPHDMKTDDWFKIARAAVDGIRSTGANNTILIPGNGWDGAWSWGSQAWYGESNAEVALRYFSSEDENIAFEVHQYFDSDYSGGHGTCEKRPCQNNVKEFVQWLKDNNLKGWFGEFSGHISDSQCKECVQEFLEYLQLNNEYVLGATWWAAGPWWGQNSYTIEPNAKKEFPGQMAWLKPYLPGPSELTEVPIYSNKKTYCKGCVVTGTGGDGSLWGWEDNKACRIDVETCKIGQDTPEPTTEPTIEPTVEPTPETGCKAEALGYKCCSTCVSILEDENGLWGAENGEWCGITDKCIQNYNECWSTQFGYPCCDTCDVFLSDESGDWGVKDLDWCGIPSTCKAT
ncbi:glycoside hydrolase [Neocallimastix lanati (nom. inval.)]|nr:glycoside hydrolase [Neocallimastix sp. JGI-2020a]